MRGSFSPAGLREERDEARMRQIVDQHPRIVVTELLDDAEGEGNGRVALLERIESPHEALRQVARRLYAQCRAHASTIPRIG